MRDWAKWFGFLEKVAERREEIGVVLAAFICAWLMTNCMGVFEHRDEMEFLGKCVEFYSPIDCRLAVDGGYAEQLPMAKQETR